MASPATRRGRADRPVTQAEKKAAHLDVLPEQAQKEHPHLASAPPRSKKALLTFPPSPFGEKPTWRSNKEEAEGQDRRGTRCTAHAHRRLQERRVD